MAFYLNELSYRIDEKEILKHINLAIPSKKFIGLIGPNGSGKSSLLKLMYRYFQPTSGQIQLHNKEIRAYSERSLAKQMAVVTQESPIIFDFTVKEIVHMGRTPFKKFLTSDSKEDEKIVIDCMQQAKVSHLANRSFASLSGGEKKRVVIARALAQKPEIFILDEPTNHLDIEHQLQLMDLISELPITIITALHDLNLAATYCDELIVLKNGQIVTFGTPIDVLTKETLKDVFHVDADVFIQPLTEKPYIQFISNKFRREF